MTIAGLGSYKRADHQCHFPTSKKGQGPPWFSRDRITGTLAIGYCRKCPLMVTSHRNRQHETDPYIANPGMVPTRLQSQSSRYNKCCKETVVKKRGSGNTPRSVNKETNLDNAGTSKTTPHARRGQLSDTSSAIGSLDRQATCHPWWMGLTHRSATDFGRVPLTCRHCLLCFESIVYFVTF